MGATAAIYCRISKDDHHERLGVDRQERLCRDLASRHDLDVVDVLIDNDVSAYKGKRRPSFERLVDLLQHRQVDAVVCYHSDRLYRRTGDLERLVDVIDNSGAQIHTVAAGNVDLSTASGRMVARMLGAAAQHEVERLGERSKAKHDELAMKGAHPGGRPPYGYSAGYIINPTEAAIVRRMADRILEGASLLKVSNELTADGIPTREGRPWHHSTVRSVLINPAVTGLRVHRRASRVASALRDSIAGPGTWEPVLDRSTWERLVAVLADPSRKRTRPARRYLLSGIVETFRGDPMIGRPDRGKAGVLDRRTYATRHPSKVSLSVDADALEALIVEMVLTRLDEAVLPVPDDHDDPSADAVTAIEAELSELAELRGAGTISMAEWLAARDPMLRRLDAARAQVAPTTRVPDRLRRLSAPGAARKAWPALDFDARREVLTAAVDKVVIGPASRGRWTEVDERVDPTNGGNVVWRA